MIITYKKCNAYEDDQNGKHSCNATYKIVVYVFFIEATYFMIPMIN